jgi:hypothetical protein
VITYLLLCKFVVFWWVSEQWFPVDVVWSTSVISECIR